MKLPAGLQGKPQSEIIEHLLYVIESMTASREDLIEGLTNSQSRIVGALMARPGRALTREALVATLVWDRPDVEGLCPKNIDVHISKACARRPDLRARIKCVWGVGFMWVPA